MSAFTETQRAVDKNTIVSPRRGEGVGTARCAVRACEYARFAVINDRDRL